jgi:hypothetical protein
MQVKIIKATRDIVAICDSELIGKTFEQGKFQLYIKESFYGGEEKTPEQTIQIMQDMLKEDATFNIVGEQAISIAIKAGIINKNSVKKIQDIPFSLVLI